MRKLNAVLAASVVCITLVACAQSPTALTTDAAVPRLGHGFGPGHNVVPAGGHGFGSGHNISSVGGHTFGSGGITSTDDTQTTETTTATQDSTAARGGHMFGSGH